MSQYHKPGTAAVLSLLIPGVGQIYNGDFLRGIFWLIITPGFWIGTAGLFGVALPLDFRLHRMPSRAGEEPVGASTSSTLSTSPFGKHRHLPPAPEAPPALQAPYFAICRP